MGWLTEKVREHEEKFLACGSREKVFYTKFRKEWRSARPLAMRQRPSEGTATTAEDTATIA